MICRAMLLAVFAGLCLAPLSHATPAPPPKPKKQPAEARLEVRSVPGRTAEEVAEERAVRLGQFRFAVDLWMLKPGTELPGLSEPYSVPRRSQWMADNFRMEYVKGTGVLRITYRAGTPREAAAFVNAAAKKCIASEEENQKAQGSALVAYEQLLTIIRSDSDHPGDIKIRQHAVVRINQLRAWQAVQPKVRILEMAPTPGEAK